MKRLTFFLFFLLTIFLSLFSQALAQIGVGVGVGKIQVDEKLKPGMIYQLPSFTVLNTGGEPSDYEISIQYHEQQPEKKPEQDWFIFSPKTFHLEPGKVKPVDVKLNLPLRMEPGDYFAYLEARPIETTQEGQTRVGIAAAARLYFTVEPTNVFSGLYYKLISFFRVYAPWPQRGLIFLSIVALLLAFKRFFNIQINLKKPKTTKEVILEDKQEKKEK